MHKRFPMILNLKNRVISLPNKDISKRDGQAFNNLNHPLSITGGGLVLTGAVLYIIGSETKDKEPDNQSFLGKLFP